MKLKFLVLVFCQSKNNQVKYIPKFIVCQDFGLHQQLTAATVHGLQFDQANYCVAVKLQFSVCLSVIKLTTLVMMVIDKYWCYLFTFQGHHYLELSFASSVNFSFYVAHIIEAHPNKFTVGMLETPLRVGVPFQVN